MRLILKFLIVLWLTLISMTQWEQQKAIDVHNEALKLLVEIEIDKAITQEF